VSRLTNAPSDIAIEVAHISKSYSRGPFRARKRVLEDVSFQVRRGSVFGFLGPNGAGKSTTIKVLLAFVHAQAGEARILGEPAGNTAVRRRIGYLPETADYYPFMSPERLLLVYADILGIPRREARTRIGELLELVGMSRERRERIGTFSKGMKQRVGIAQALLNEPDVLILDEPASGLDPLGQREIRDLILAQKQRGRTIFFSSHELTEVEQVCDEAAIIRAGRIIRQGALSELVPYRQDLLVRVRNIDRAAVESRPFVRDFPAPPRAGELTFVAAPGHSVEELARLVREAGGEVLSVSTVRDSLEDVFLRLMREEQ
jgi:ABC-2 type transport system ATP-binding protein